jgi:hypothetical protein
MPAIAELYPGEHYLDDRHAKPSRKSGVTRLPEYRPVP